MNCIKKISVFLLLTQLLVACTSQFEQSVNIIPAAQKSLEQLIRVPYQSSVDNSKRNYFVYLPRGYDSETNKKWPVMLFLHGNGERGNGQDELDFVMMQGPLYEA